MRLLGNVRRSRALFGRRVIAQAAGTTHAEGAAPPADRGAGSWGPRGWPSRPGRGLPCRLQTATCSPSSPVGDRSGREGAPPGVSSQEGADHTRPGPHPRHLAGTYPAPHRPPSAHGGMGIGTSTGGSEGTLVGPQHSGRGLFCLRNAQIPPLFPQAQHVTSPLLLLKTRMPKKGQCHLLTSRPTATNRGRTLHRTSPCDAQPPAGPTPLLGGTPCSPHPFSSHQPLPLC